MPIDDLAPALATLACARAEAPRTDTGDAWLEHPRLLEALALASPSLVARLSEWRASAGGGAPRLPIELAVPIARYLTRMCARATPFGLFAAVSYLEVGAENAIELEAPDRVVRHSRVDMEVLSDLCDAVARRRRGSLCFWPTTSLDRSEGNAVRYVAVTRDGRGRRHYRLAELARDAALDAAIEAARDGAGIEAIAERVRDAAGEVALDEARAYVETLVDEALLVSELSPPLTSAAPAGDVACRMRERGIEEAALVDAVVRAMSELDAAAPEHAAEATSRARTVVEEAVASSGAETSLSDWLHVDLVRPLREGVVARSLIDEIEHVVRTFRAIGAAEHDSLASYRADFRERYGGAEVPLAEALDPERGVRFRPAEPATSPVLRGLDLARRAPNEVRFEPQQEYVLARLHELSARGEREWALTETDLLALRRPHALPLPDRFEVKVTLVEDDEGRARCVFDATGGWSGALVGRFMHLDERLAERGRAYLQEPDRAEVVYAQIVHSPQTRAGNVLARVPSGAYELAYLGTSSKRGEHLITIDDLRLRLDGDELVLRSHRLGRRVIPRLANAHKFRAPTSLPVYRFLCELARQGRDLVLGFPWGPLDAAPWLPRVTLGRHVLTGERFRLDARRGSAAAQLDALGVRRPPRYCALVEAGAAHPVDLSTPISASSVDRALERDGAATLVELPVNLGRMPARGERGRYVSELVVPFIARTPAEPRPSRSVAAGAPAESSPPRRLLPGREWAYVKLYGGPLTTERVLVERVAPFLEERRRDGSARAFFFVRYADPEEHVRVRVEARQPLAIASELIDLVADGPGIRRVAIDTYEREIERYGGPAGIIDCEALFAHDSDALTELLSSVLPEERNEDRLALAISGVDALFADLGLAHFDRLTCLEPAREAFLRGRAKPHELHLGLGAQYRARRERATAIVAGRPNEPIDVLAGEVFGRRSARNAPFVARLREAAARGELTVSLTDLARSLAHMHTNRVFRTFQNLHEAVVYDHLIRTYRSVLARAGAGRATERGA